jgi:hypothetical protein
MRDAARTLASYGRNGDNMLVHVSRKELEGIRALTGRDFTRNPDTGLPEAFNFSSLIPAAAGLAGTVLSGGNPLVGAAAAGVAGAGTAAARGGSVQDALTQGLISGATTYAGGQIMAGVGDAASAAAGGGADAAAQGAASTAAQSATSSAIPGSAADIGSFGISAPPPAAASPSFTAGFGPQMTSQQALNLAATGTASPTLGQSLAAAPAYASNFGDTVSNIASQPGAALSKIGENIAARPFSALVAGGGTLMQASDMMGGGPAIPGQTPYDANRYPERFPLNPRSWNAPPVGYRPGAGPEYRYFAKGGLASMRSDDGYTANLMNEAKAAILGEHPRPREAMERFREAFGEDALSLLRDRLTGGQVRGAGSGMDDLVPGTIEGRQKVRLADGEFVVPADVVSGLGDGSTDHGVRRLHGMMDKVRQDRTGKRAQPKSIGGKITL